MYSHSLHLARLGAPFLLAAILGEIAFFALRGREYPWRETGTSLVISLAHMPAHLLTPIMVAPLALFLWSHRLWTVPLDSGWGVAALFLAVELSYYWMHRSGHEIRWMWASHMVHHTPDRIHLASALRLGVTELLSGNWLFYMPLYLIGFDPLGVASMLTANLFYQFWLHTETIGRLGPLEWLFNTPAHHRIHHASNAAYLDRNYGGVLIIWDRLFGTYADELPEEPPVYGLVHPLGTANPLKILFHEWISIGRDVARAASWQGKWRALAGRPGEKIEGVVS